MHLEDKLDAIEEKLDMTLALVQEESLRIETDLPLCRKLDGLGEGQEEIRSFISIIKVIRNRLGCGLKEAKLMAEGLAENDPRKFWINFMKGSEGVIDLAALKLENRGLRFRNEELHQINSDLQEALSNERYEELERLEQPPIEYIILSPLPLGA